MHGVLKNPRGGATIPPDGWTINFFKSSIANWYNLPMHAYLIVSKEEVEIQAKINDITQKEKAQKFNFELQTIEKVREMQRFIKLHQNQKTAIIVKNIEKSSLPALNALLKNLEEPPQNIIFILTTDNSSHLISTITSRCQVIKIKKNQRLNTQDSEEIQNFLNQNIGARFLKLEKIKKREEATEFLQKLINFYHETLLNQEDESEKVKIAVSLEIADETLKRIKDNGNIKLQLTRLALKI